MGGAWGTMSGTGVLSLLSLSLFSLSLLCFLCFLGESLSLRELLCESLCDESLVEESRDRSV